MINPATLIGIYDKSLIELAIQSYFCQPAIGVFVAPPTEGGPGWDQREEWTPKGLIPFFTAFEDMMFMKHRPRVGLDLNGIAEIPKSWIVDTDQVLRAKSWSARLIFGLVTLPNYQEHTQLRALVEAIIPALGPRVNADRSGISAGGINQFLKTLELATIVASDNSTHVTPQDGQYYSKINCLITFSVRPGSWPGGTINQ